MAGPFGPICLPTTFRLRSMGFIMGKANSVVLELGMMRNHNNNIQHGLSTESRLSNLITGLVWISGEYLSYPGQVCLDFLYTGVGNIEMRSSTESHSRLLLGYFISNRLD